METRLLDARTDPEPALEEAASILRRGGLVAFPTETVYGLGARGLDVAAVERIFQAKGRPHTDPLILHVADLRWLQELARELPPTTLEVAARFWPGPLTLVVPKSSRVPDLVTAGKDSVALRMPSHPLALELIRRVAEPVAAPSANLFSRPSPTTAAHVLADLGGRIDAVLDGGPTEVGLESTIIDLRGRVPVLLRPGGVTREALEEALGSVVIPESLVDDTQPQAAPGQLTRHYSPHAEVFLYDGPDAQVVEAIRQLSEEPGPTVVLAFSEDLPALQGLAVSVIHLGSRADPEHLAGSLYAALRDADDLGAARIAVRTVLPGGLGDALNDRLRRAASGRILRPQ